MTANVQVSTKLNDGRIFVIAGDNADDFYANAAAMLGAENVDELIADFKVLNSPGQVGPPAQQYQQPQQGYQQPAQQSYAPRQGAGSPPGDQVLCPTHGQPAVWKEGGVSQAGKPYNGFWKCATTGSSISGFNNGPMKTSCPPPRG